MGDEVLQRLVVDRVAQASMHRLHRLPFAVVEEAFEVLTGGMALDTPAEAIRELVGELAEAIEQRSRAARIHARNRREFAPESTVRSFGSRCTNQ
jgi:hypothetical protein